MSDEGFSYGWRSQQAIDQGYPTFYAWNYEQEITPGEAEVSFLCDSSETPPEGFPEAECVGLISRRFPLYLRPGKPDTRIHFSDTPFDRWVKWAEEHVALLRTLKAETRS